MPRLRCLLFALALVPLASCTLEPPFDPPEQPPVGEIYAASRNGFESVLRTPRTGIEDVRRGIVASESEWLGLWLEIWTPVGPVPDPPRIDFSRELVVVAAMGLRPTGGYSIRIDQVIQRQGFVEVRLIETEPPPGCEVTQEETTPLDLARIPRVQQPFRFEVERFVGSCG